MASSCSTQELKSELSALGLPTSGLKNDLVGRLEEALTKAAGASSDLPPVAAPKGK